MVMRLGSMKWMGWDGKAVMCYGMVGSSLEMEGRGGMGKEEGEWMATIREMKETRE